MATFYCSYCTIGHSYIVIGGITVRRKAAVNRAGYVAIINSYIILDSIAVFRKATVNCFYSASINGYITAACICVIV